jgi:hypothetical protein
MTVTEELNNATDAAMKHILWAEESIHDACRGVAERHKSGLGHAYSQGPTPNAVEIVNRSFALYQACECLKSLLKQS